MYGRAFLVLGFGHALMSCQDARQIDSPLSACLTDIPPPAMLGGGEAFIGYDSAYPEEAPVRLASIAPFDIDAAEVTNRQFSAFVSATGYVTSAEKPQAGFNLAGAAVFRPPSAENPSWWQFVPGANWRHPEGPQSNIKDRDLDPVVQVSFGDAAAYAKWAGRRLPSEAEWEYAAKAGSDTLYVWGHERAPRGHEKANTWQGAFPAENTAADGYLRRAPIGCFPPNNFGLYDMIGNVWEWTDSRFSQSQSVQSVGEPIYTIKGGSFLCAENYCRRYRAAARQPQEAGFPTNHIGFRTVSK